MRVGGKRRTLVPPSNTLDKWEPLTLTLSLTLSLTLNLTLTLILTPTLTQVGAPAQPGHGPLRRGAHRHRRGGCANPNPSP